MNVHEEAIDLGVIGWARDIANTSGDANLDWSTILRFVVECARLGVI